MAIKEEPHRAATYLSRGIVYAYMERFDEALADFNAAVRLAPCDYLGYYYRGLCLIEMTRYHEAEDDLSYALRLEPGDSQTLLEYAEAIAVLRQMDDS